MERDRQRDWPAIYGWTRLLQIAGCSAWYLGRFLVHAAWVRVFAGAAQPGLAGRYAAACCEALGPFFIKVGQILGTRRDLLPPAAADELARLQDSARPVAESRREAWLRDSLGGAPERWFAEFVRSPIASASIAQVHRARLHDGSLVAVKIRRPGIVRTIRADRRAACLLAAWIERLPGWRTVPLRAIMDEFGRVIEAQLDFDREADNCDRMRTNVAPLGYVVVPRIHRQFCSNRVLTMEYLSQLTSTGEAAGWSHEERSRIAVRSVHAVYTMTFVHGFLHGDLHPGNLFFRPGGMLVLLDFGIIADLEGRNLKHFADFFFGIVTNNGRDCARVIYQTAIDPPAAAWDGFAADMDEMVGRYSRKRAREFEVSRFAVELFDCQRRHGVRGSTRFMTTILAFTVFEGIAKQIDPELDFQGEARQFIPQVLRRLAHPHPRVEAHAGA
jgi:ubiquinone biosynthesis protein